MNLYKVSVKRNGVDVDKHVVTSKIGNVEDIITKSMGNVILIKNIELIDTIVFVDADEMISKLANRG